MKKGNKRLVERPEQNSNIKNKLKTTKTHQYLFLIFSLFNKYVKINNLLPMTVILLLILPHIECKTNNSEVYNVLVKNKRCPTTTVRQERAVEKDIERDVEREVEEDEDFDLDPDSEQIEELMTEQVKRPSVPVTTMCNSCRMREEVRIISLKAIKNDILSKLGMSSIPNVTNRVDDPRLARLLQKIEHDKQNKHHGHRKVHHGSSNGIFWIHPEDEMMGDEPADSDFSVKHRSQLYNSDKSRHKFEEGEVLLEEDDDYHIKTEKVIAFAQPFTRLRHGGRLDDIQRFEFSDRVRNNRVVSASVWIYIRGKQWRKSTSNSASINISVYRVSKLSQTAKEMESPVIHTVISHLKQPQPNGTGAWINIDHHKIEQLVSDWFKNPQNNLGIVIKAEDDQEKNLAVTSHTSQDSSLVPFLEVHVTDLKKHRTKRTIGLNCQDNSSETRCCRYPLTVDFEEFGWDWIIAPKKYDANYCSGDCPYVYLTRYPHTHIIQQANVPHGGPCCAPRKLSPISMLYFDNNNNIIYGTLPSMVVDRCGCT